MTLLIIGLVLGYGCRKPTLIDNLYSLPDPVSDWSRVEPGSADRAWRHNQNHAVMYVDVNCESKFRDRSLDDSMLSLFWGIKVGEILHRERMEIARRAALYQVVGAEIDGVYAKLGGVVVSKNACLYDFLLISQPGDYDSNALAFLELAKGLSTIQSNSAAKTGE